MSGTDNEINGSFFADDVEAILPDGWGENDDIFDSDSWTGSAVADDPQAGNEGGEPAAEDGTAPAIEQNTEPTVDPDAAALEAQLQAAAGVGKLKFKTQYNHEELDVELNESDLPEVYQKSLALDRTREKLTKMTPTMDKAEKLAKSMGYDSVDAMLDSAATNYRQNEIEQLVADGVHKAVAEDIVDRKLKAVSASQTPETEPAEKPEPDPTPTAEQKRNWGSEVAELMKARPQLRGKELPKQVQEKAVKEGTPLLVAYLEYENEQSKAEITRLTKANKTHEHNAASAVRAPVTGVTGGGSTDTEPSDPFLDGFNSVFS